MLGMALFAPAMFQKVMQAQEKDRDNIVAEEKFARLEKIEEGVYAMVSTPSFKEGKHFTTVCNGGIIAGEKGVLAIESFMQPKGATWLANQAKALTGKWPTDIVSTHHHGDHTTGHKGYFVDGNKPRVWLTDSTRKAAEGGFKQRGMKDNDFENISTIDGESEIDLGNRKVKLINRSGHTNSDVTIEVVDPKVVFCGDLFFNRMFPNYGDAIPSKLEKYLKEITAAKDVTYVPGHGPIADVEAMQ